MSVGFIAIIGGGGGGGTSRMPFLGAVICMKPAHAGLGDRSDIRMFSIGDLPWSFDCLWELLVDFHT